MNVVTRFAPSPTGYLHIGGARTALFSWAYAKRNNGKFILRIEDTDLERSTPEAIEAIKEGMKWLSFDFDGPIVFQTERFDRYKLAIADLINNDHAYYCYASIDELSALRENQIKKGLKPKYDKSLASRAQQRITPNPPKELILSFDLKTHCLVQ